MLETCGEISKHANKAFATKMLLNCWETFLLYGKQTFFTTTFFLADKLGNIGRRHNVCWLWGVTVSEIMPYV